MRILSTPHTAPMATAMIVCLLAMVCAGTVRADPLLHLEQAHDPEARQAVHHAQHEVDLAWATFHQAALGGTLASPAIQADVEQSLQEARGLLVKAREAAERGDRKTLDPLLERIHELSERAIRESQEPKR